MSSCSTTRERAERTVSADTVFKGRALRVDVLEIEQPGGRHARREILRHPGAVVVLARLPDGRFVFVRQYRKAIEENLLELVAGTLEAGEPPESCARRELREETGYGASSIRPLGTIVPAPGYSEERLHLFYAELDGVENPLPPDDDEQIEVVLLGADDIERMIAEGELHDAKSLSGWLIWTRSREREVADAPRN